MNISNDEAVKLVLDIYNKGHKPTAEELHRLEILTILNLSGKTLHSLNLDVASNFWENLNLDVVPNLQYLDLSETCISSLEGISKLTKLRSLNISRTAVDSLEKLNELIDLQYLDSSHTSIVSLNGVSKLTKLLHLNLSDTKICSLEGIEEIINLETLDLGNTLISSIENLGRLVNLRIINLHNTQVKSLEELFALKKLWYLDVSATLFDHIPQWFVTRRFFFETGDGKGKEPSINIKDVQLLEQPISLFHCSYDFIEAYFNEELESYNEAKVIFLGDGGVGKTYTIDRIEHSNNPPINTQATPGVQISRYERDGKATINFWDFGGQEIMYSMHRCFLTDRTCYVVVVSNRYDIMKQARYWLKSIECFAPHANVILAVNQWECVSDLGIDEIRLKKEFKSKFVIEKYTATQPDSVKKLIEKIDNQIEHLTSVKMCFPSSWYGIINKLRNMNKCHISKSEYFKICRKELGDRFNESICEWLLKWFNDLGICFNFHQDKDVSSKSLILEPKWLTNAIYIIVNNCRGSGMIHRDAILNALKCPKHGLSVIEGMEYNEEELHYILRIMRIFRLSFQIDESREFIPSLYPKQVPKDLEEIKKKVIDQSHTLCEIEYKYLPESVVHRLMIDCHSIFSFTSCWFYGFSVQTYDNLIAICEKNEGEDLLTLDIYGEKEKTGLLGVLMDTLNKINKEMSLEPKCYVCLEKYGSKKRWELEKLLEKQRVGQEILGDDECNLYSIDEVLGTIVSTDVLLEIWKLLLKNGISSNDYMNKLFDILAEAERKQISPMECLKILKKRINRKEDGYHRTSSISIENAVGCHFGNSGEVNNEK